MILLSVGGVLVGLKPAERKSKLMLTEGSDQVDPNVPWPPTPTFCCCPMGGWDDMAPKLWKTNKNVFFTQYKNKYSDMYNNWKCTFSTEVPSPNFYLFSYFISWEKWDYLVTAPTCWERERGMVGKPPEAPGVTPPRENVRLWEALSVVCGLVIWLLTPLIKSKSSAEGGIEVVLEVGAVGDWTLPNKSATGWEGPELDDAGGLAEKAFQSPNSPFPLDDAAAANWTAKVRLVVTYWQELLHSFTASFFKNVLLNIHSQKKKKVYIKV